MRSRNGFTRTEMVVVMGVVALLLATVLPGVQTAQQQAERAVCLGRLSNIGKAMHAYAADHNGTFTTNNRYHGYLSACWTYWPTGPTNAEAYAVDGYLGGQPMTKEEIIANPDLFQCVNWSQRYEEWGPVMASFLSGYSSRWFETENGRSGYSAGFPEADYGYPFDPGAALRACQESFVPYRLDQLRVPSAKLVYTDLLWSNDPEMLMHREGQNALFVDGSGQWASDENAAQTDRGHHRRVHPSSWIFCSFSQAFRV